MPRSKHPPRTNRLLDELSVADRQRLIADCEPVELAVGEVAAHYGKPLTHVYFPTDCFVSLMSAMVGGANLQVALVGNEGMIGVPLVLGVDQSPFHAVVRGAGPALRMSATQFRRALGNGSSLRKDFLRYVFVQMIQLGQTAGCTRFHVVEERLARWLLMTADRAHSEEFHMTHEVLATTLGVRRVGVTRAASSLQEGKFIKYSRGDIAILDRKGLEGESCGCYGADLATYERVLG